MQSHFYIHYLYSRCVGESLYSWKLSSMMLLYNPTCFYWQLFGKLQSRLFLVTAFECALFPVWMVGWMDLLQSLTKS